MIALLMEIAFARGNVGQRLDDRVTPVLLFRSDITRRLERAGAKQGDIQISLAWNNRNDLDLWCVDPNNEKIFYGHNVVRSGGELDVDRNAHLPYDPEPIEHIYWPAGRAPAGRYKVYVDFYDRHSPEDATPYRLEVYIRGQVHRVSGIIERRDPTRLAYTFTLNKSGAVMGLLPPEFWRSVVLMGLWAGLVGVALAAGLVAAQAGYLKRRGLARLLTLPRFAIVLGCAFVCGIASGVIGQACFSALPDALVNSSSPFGRIIGLVLTGGILGLSLGVVVPNLSKKSGLYAGALGGLAIAISFGMAATQDKDALGRVLGATLFGFAIGWMISLFVVPTPPPAPVIVREPRVPLKPLTLRGQRTSSVGKLRTPGAESNTILPETTGSSIQDP